MIRHIWVEKTTVTLVTRRRSFTLTELLVTIAIISILMTIAWGAIGRVREQGRVAKTKSTISKINQIVMAQYDGYRTRRVPVDTRGLPPVIAARFRLWAIRCIMAWEMPDQWDDVDPTVGIVSSYTLEIEHENRLYARTVSAPALWHKYTRFLTTLNAQAVSAKIHSGQLAPEEENRYARLLNAVLLYMIVCGANPDKRELFMDNEVAYLPFPGLDQQGRDITVMLPVFVDGWGNPIFFIRCPVGFPDSEIQVPDAQNHHDPFDPLRVDPSAYATFPLVFSPGPDGAIGLSFGVCQVDAFGGSGDANYMCFAVSRNWTARVMPIEAFRNRPDSRMYDWFNLDFTPGGNLSGAPYKKVPEDDQEQQHYPNAHLDNIHNHRAETMP